MMGCHGTEFFAADGVADEYGGANLESVKYGNYVVSKSLCPVTSCGGRRLTEASPRDAIDVKVLAELRSEIVEDVRSVPQAR
jgi:hypothetical protein